MIISGDSLPSDINLIDLTLVKPTPDYVDINGNVASMSSGADPETAREPSAVTFTREESYLRLPLWDALLRGSIEFSFKTVEPNGLIVYNGGQPGFRDLFAVELYDGVPFVVIDLGEGVHRFRFDARPGRTFNDGLPHHLRVDRVERSLRLTIDKEERAQTIVSGQNTLNLGTFLFLGAVDNPNRLPWTLWTRRSKFFTGCIWGMKVNDGDVLDLQEFAAEQGMTGLEVGCKAKPLECAHTPCLHGTCANRFTGYSCQCHETGYTGRMCNVG